MVYYGLLANINSINHSHRLHKLTIKSSKIPDQLTPHKLSENQENSRCYFLRSLVFCLKGARCMGKQQKKPTQLCLSRDLGWAWQNQPGLCFSSPWCWWRGPGTCPWGCGGDSPPSPPRLHRGTSWGGRGAARPRPRGGRGAGDNYPTQLFWSFTTRGWSLSLNMCADHNRGEIL